MADFAEAFRNARVNKRVTLRRIKEATGKSIGYLSDIEHRRKAPPDLETARKIEEVLEIYDGHLVALAHQGRRDVNPEIKTLLRRRPQVAEMLLRAAESFSDDELRQALADFEEKRS